MKKIILIKLGGSVITDKSKPYTAKPRTIRRLAREIKYCWDKGYRFLIAHGGGSFPHTSASKYKTAEGLTDEKSVFGLAVVQQDAIAINRIVNKIFLEEGLPVLSFAPSSFSVAKDGRLKDIFVEPIAEALKIDSLPLVFGDIVLDTKRGCTIFSGETTLDNLINPLKESGVFVDKVIQCGNTDGVYDGKGKTIPAITGKSFSILKKHISGSSSADVTGGMLHKIKESLKMAGSGIDCLIINGEKKKALLKAVSGEPVLGTLVTKII